MFARIFQPAKTAMQSGKARAGRWRLEFETETARRIDPLMGWTSGSDMRANQVAIEFESREAAIAYCERHGLPYQVVDAPELKPTPKAYSDNFAFRRRTPWTH